MLRDDKLRNLIKEYWRPEYWNDRTLVGLLGSLSGVISTYEGHLQRYRTSDDGSVVERQEDAWLRDHGLQYNEDIKKYEDQFRAYVRARYHHEVP